MIDFQDARLGPDTYDLVSLLRDSYVDPTERTWTADRLLPRAQRHAGRAAEFRRRFDLMAVQRNLKRSAPSATRPRRGNRRHPASAHAPREHESREVSPLRAAADDARAASWTSCDNARWIARAFGVSTHLYHGRPADSQSPARNRRGGIRDRRGARDAIAHRPQHGGHRRPPAVAGGGRADAAQRARAARDAFSPGAGMRLVDRRRRSRREPAPWRKPSARC